MTSSRLVRVLHVLSGGTVGGCEQHVLSLPSSLDRSRYEPWLAVFEAEPDAAAPMLPMFQAAGVPTVDLRARSRSDPGALLRLGRLIRRVDFDILHAHSFRTEQAAVLWGRVLGRVPVVVRTVHNTDDFYTRPIYSTLARASAQRLDRIVVISDAVGRYLRDEGRLPADRITRIYYGLDPAPFSRNGSESHTRPPTIGVIARLAPQKGHRVLFDALPALLEQVPDLRVRVIGHEELSTVAELRAHAAARGVADHVSFEGFVADVPAALHQLDVLVLPSLWEGFGLVLLEGMAAGRPIVASAVGPIPEVVEDGTTGLLVPPGEPATLGAAIGRLLKERAYAERLGRAGRERVGRVFGLERMVRETDTLYQQLLAGAR